MVTVTVLGMAVSSPAVISAPALPLGRQLCATTRVLQHCPAALLVRWRTEPQGHSAPAHTLGWQLCATTRMLQHNPSSLPVPWRTRPRGYIAPPYALERQ